MYANSTEQDLVQLLQDCQAQRQAAERKLQAARDTLVEKEQAEQHCQFTLDHYRKMRGLPQQMDPSPVLESEYASMTPTEMVEHWAKKHGGLVVVKNLVKDLVKAGMFPARRTAASNIYGVLQRKKYVKIKPGQYSAPQPPSGFVPKPKIVVASATQPAPALRILPQHSPR